MLIRPGFLRKDPLLPASMQMYRVHRIWIAFSTLLVVALGAWWAADSISAGRLSGGGSIPGLATGIVGALIILFEMFLSWRKSKRTLRIGRVKYWMAGHIWLGLACYPILLFHCGIASWGGQLTSLLMILLTIVVFSGVYGLRLQQRLPGTMLREVPAETIYSQIHQLIDYNLSEAHRLVEAVCGKIPAQPPHAHANAHRVPDAKPAAAIPGQPQTHPHPHPDAQRFATMMSMDSLAASPVLEKDSNTSENHFTVASIRTAGNVQGRVLQTKTPVKAVFGAEPLRIFFQNQARDYLRRGNKARSPLCESIRSRGIFQELKTKVNPAAHDAVDLLADLVDQRRQLDSQMRLHRKLHRWLWCHVPLSTVLIILMFAHIYYAFLYR